MPAGYLTLELEKLIVPQLDSSLSEERPSLDGLKPLLVFRAPEPMSVEVHIGLQGRTGTLSSGVFPGPLCGDLSRGHLLRGHICKVTWQEISIQHHKNQATHKKTHVKCQCDFREKLTFMHTHFSLSGKKYFMRYIDAILPRKGPVTRAMSKRLQEDWARAAEDGPRVLINLRIDF